MKRFKIESGGGRTAIRESQVKIWEGWRCALVIVFAIALGGWRCGAAEPETSPNDAAAFLAGIPPAPGSPLEPLARDPAWGDHSKFFESAWAKLDKAQLSNVRAWSAEYLASAPQPGTVFYMFSGPDYLYANAFFPDASTYVLCGIEPVGEPPDPLRIPPQDLPGVLSNLRTSLNSVLNFSFFITKDMKVDLDRQELRGTLPILYVFLARSGKQIHEVTFVSLNKDGTAPARAAGKGPATGVKITFAKPGGPEQTLYYFSTDISDDGLRHSGFLEFCARLGPGRSLLKAASYLPHENGFEKIRGFLLEKSEVIVQDDSGVPVHFFDPEHWQLRLFGTYPGPIDLFKKYYQADLAQLYQQSHAPALSFGIGYRWNARQSCLILAVRQNLQN